MPQPTEPRVPPSRLVIAGALLLGVALAAVWLEGRSPALLPLLAVAGCAVFHWLGHGRHLSSTSGTAADQAGGSQRSRSPVQAYFRPDPLSLDRSSRSWPAVSGAAASRIVTPQRGRTDVVVH